MNTLYIVYQLLIAIPIFLVLTILTAVITIVGCFFGNGNVWGYYPGEIWSKLTCWVYLLPVRVSGREHLVSGESYVFVVNHQGAFDIFLIYGFLHRNFKWMMKKGLRKLPFVGKACEAAGHIFVDKSSPQRIKNTILQAEQTLKKGVSLVVFPEGERSKDGALHTFKRGAFQLADELRLSVVPITIEGSYKVLSRGKLLATWSPLKVTIHPPIPPLAESGAENLKYLSNKSYEIISHSLK